MTDTRRLASTRQWLASVRTICSCLGLNFEKRLEKCQLDSDAAPTAGYFPSRFVERVLTCQNERLRRGRYDAPVKASQLRNNAGVFFSAQFHDTDMTILWCKTLFRYISWRNLQHADIFWGDSPRIGRFSEGSLASVDCLREASLLQGLQMKVLHFRIIWQWPFTGTISEGGVIGRFSNQTFFTSTDFTHNEYFLLTEVVEGNLDSTKLPTKALNRCIFR